MKKKISLRDFVSSMLLTLLVWQSSFIYVPNTQAQSAIPSKPATSVADTTTATTGLSSTYLASMLDPESDEFHEIEVKIFRLRLILADLVEASGRESEELRTAETKKVVLQNALFFMQLVKDHEFKVLLRAIDLAGTTRKLNFEFLQSTFTYCLTEIDNLAKKSPAAVMAIISGVSTVSSIENAPFTLLAKQIRQEVQEMKFSELDAVKTLEDPAKGINFKGANPKIKKFFELVLHDYFDHMPVEDKSVLMAAYLRLSPHATIEQTMATLLQYSGPILQKLFQLFGDDASSPIVKKVMGQLKSQIRPFPFEEVKKTIEKSYKKKMEDIFSEFGQKHLAAATIGQVHLATLKSTGDKIIIKVMRPGIVERGAREVALLKSLTKDPGILDILAKLDESLREECDFRNEGEGLKKGRVYHQLERGIIPVGMVKELPVMEKVLPMQLAAGKSIAKATDDSLLKQAMAFRNLIYMWVKEALFDGGFFHGDLHSGNIFFDPIGREGEDPEYLMTLIDFGSYATLSPEIRHGIVNMLLSLAVASPELLLENFEKIIPMTREQRRAFAPIVQASVKENLDSVSIFQKLINKAVDLEFKIPRELIMFNRGKAFIEKQIEDLNKRLDEKPETRCYKIDLPKLYRRLFLKNLSYDLSRSLLHLNRSQPRVIRFRSVLRLLKEYFSPSDIPQECLQEEEDYSYELPYGIDFMDEPLYLNGGSIYNYSGEDW